MTPYMETWAPTIIFRMGHAPCMSLGLAARRSRAWRYGPVEVYRRTPNLHTQSETARNEKPTAGVGGSSQWGAPVRFACPSTAATGKYETHPSGTTNVRKSRNQRV